jgi:S1-C subfamily serine protease
VIALLIRYVVAGCLVILAFVNAAKADSTVAPASQAMARSVQTKLVKIYGAGGFGSLESYQSGFFISDQGHVLTSWSTVLDVSVVRVVTSDGVRHEATIVGSDPTTELAVLKIEVSGNEFFAIDDSRSIAPGTRVFAVSNLFNIAAGDEPVSVQRGVVMAITQLSAKRGRLKTIYQGPILVLDAMTNNPGATGGVAIDMQGRAIGMLGKELRDEGSSIYMNYALPVNVLAGSIKRIMSGEAIVAKRDQAMLPTANPHTLTLIGITLVPDVLTKTPPYIDQIDDGSIAQRSGLLSNDLILLVNSQRIDSQATLRSFLATIDQNDSYTMLVQRGQELVQIEVKP